MECSPPSASVILPFGSLTGVIPVDAVGRGRVLQALAAVPEPASQRESDIQRQIHSAIDPFAPPARDRLIEEAR